MTLSLAKEIQSSKSLATLEILSHTVNSPVALETSCLELSCVSGSWEHLKSFFVLLTGDEELGAPNPTNTLSDSSSELAVCSEPQLAPWQLWPRARKQNELG